jgi:hypothetical protein
MLKKLERPLDSAGRSPYNVGVGQRDDPKQKTKDRTMIVTGMNVQLHITRNGIDIIRSGRIEKMTDKVVVLLKDDGKYGTYRRADINIYGRMQS